MNENGKSQEAEILGIISFSNGPVTFQLTKAYASAEPFS
jgi:hypothetical protein